MTLVHVQFVSVQCQVCLEQERTASVDEESLTTSRIIAEVFATITAVPSIDAAEAETIAIETLFDAHHPIIGSSLLLLLHVVVFYILSSVFLHTLFDC